MLIGQTQLELVQGDITTQDEDAIVNAANRGLAVGGGVDGAVHRAGGPAIVDECRKIGGCPTGEARITSGGNLKARWVIHAVGPVYDVTSKLSPVLLAAAYRNSLQVAVENAVRSIAFPPLSTGAYRYPVRLASEIALKTVIEFLESETHELELVRFVLFDKSTLGAYGTSLERLRSE